MNLAKGDIGGDRQQENAPLGDHKRQPGFIVEASHYDHSSMPPKVHQIQQSYYTQRRTCDARRIRGVCCKVFFNSGLGCSGFLAAFSIWRPWWWWDATLSAPRGAMTDLRANTMSLFCEYSIDGAVSAGYSTFLAFQHPLGTRSVESRG